MISRTVNTYVDLPEELTGKKKKSEAKSTMTIQVVVPADFEKKAQKFMDEQLDEVSKKFKKFVKKEIDKRME